MADYYVRRDPIVLRQVIEEIMSSPWPVLRDPEKISSQFPDHKPELWKCFDDLFGIEKRLGC